MKIRQAKPEEAEQVLAFYYNLIDGMKDAEYPIRWVKGVYPTLEDMKSAADEGNLFVAEESEDVIGAFVLNHSQNESYKNVHWTFAADPDKTAVLHLLATDPKRQRRGIGKMLLGEAVRISRERGDQVMRLDTLTWNVPGQKLYEGFGFHCCGDVELDYPSTGKIPFRMYEYSALTIRKAREMGIRGELYLSVHKDNPASLKVMLNNGGYIHHENDEEYFDKAYGKNTIPEEITGMDN